MKERDILHAVRLVFGQQPDFVIWRNSTGYDERGFRYGLCVGSSDLVGLAPGGLFLAIETKTDKGRASAEQIRFLELVWKMGGVACLTRSAEEARKQVDGIRAGQRKFY